MTGQPTWTPPEIRYVLDAAIKQGLPFEDIKEGFEKQFGKIFTRNKLRYCKTHYGIDVDYGALLVTCPKRPRKQKRKRSSNDDEAQDAPPTGIARTEELEQEDQEKPLSHARSQVRKRSTQQSFKAKAAEEKQDDGQKLLISQLPLEQPQRPLPSWYQSHQPRHTQTALHQDHQDHQDHQNHQGTSNSSFVITSVRNSNWNSNQPQTAPTTHGNSQQLKPCWSVDSLPAMPAMPNSLRPHELSHMDSTAQFNDSNNMIPPSMFNSHNFATRPNYAMSTSPQPPEVLLGGFPDNNSTVMSPTRWTDSHFIPLNYSFGNRPTTKTPTGMLPSAETPRQVLSQHQQGAVSFKNEPQTQDVFMSPQQSTFDQLRMLALSTENHPQSPHSNANLFNYNHQPQHSPAMTSRPHQLHPLFESIDPRLLGSPQESDRSLKLERSTPDK